MFPIVALIVVLPQTSSPARSPARSPSSVPPCAEAVLEDLALSASGLTEPARRDAGGPMEAAHEVRQVGEADVEGDVGDGSGAVREPARGVAQPCRDQVLVGRHAQRAAEEPEEVKRAEA